LRSKLFNLVILVFANSLCAQNVPSTATYTLKATPKTVAWGYYDAKAAPVLVSNRVTLSVRKWNQNAA
jgi:hypothetical protein